MMGKLEHTCRVNSDSAKDFMRTARPIQQNSYPLCLQVKLAALYAEARADEGELRRVQQRQLLLAGADPLSLPPWRQMRAAEAARLGLGLDGTLASSAKARSVKHQGAGTAAHAKARSPRASAAGATAGQASCAVFRRGDSRWLPRHKHGHVLVTATPAALFKPCLLLSLHQVT